jgi:hypothetical protein
VKLKVTAVSILVPRFPWQVQIFLDFFSGRNILRALSPRVRYETFFHGNPGEASLMRARRKSKNLQIARQRLAGLKKIKPKPDFGG